MNTTQNIQTDIKNSLTNALLLKRGLDMVYEAIVGPEETETEPEGKENE